MLHRCSRLAAVSKVRMRWLPPWSAMRKCSPASVVVHSPWRSTSSLVIGSLGRAFFSFSVQRRPHAVEGGDLLKELVRHKTWVAAQRGEYRSCEREREREMFYLTTHSTHFIYGYMASDIWLRTILIVRKETRCRHICYSYRLTARVFLYAPSHRQNNTYHGLCYTSRGALAGTRNSSMGPPHEGSIRRPIAP